VKAICASENFDFFIALSHCRPRAAHALNWILLQKSVAGERKKVNVHSKPDHGENRSKRRPFGAGLSSSVMAGQRPPDAPRPGLDV